MEIIEKGKKRVFKCIHCECILKTVKYFKVGNGVIMDAYFKVTCPECQNSFGIEEYNLTNKTK